MSRMLGGGNVKKGLVNSWEWALIPAKLLPTSALTKTYLSINKYTLLLGNESSQIIFKDYKTILKEVTSEVVGPFISKKI